MITADDAIRFTDDIDGWCSEEERRWLFTQAQQIPLFGSWVEVGTWKGRSFFAVAAGLPNGAWLYAVDHFAGSADETKGVQKEAAKPGFPIMGDFVTNLRRFLTEVRSDIRIVIVAASSLEAAKRFQGAMIDAVYIDGGHLQEEVLADIREWGRVVRPQGLLCGHDASELFHPGVELALAESRMNYDRPAGSIWRRKVQKGEHFQVG